MDLKKRRSGSAKDDAVYCIRGDSDAYPHAHVWERLSGIRLAKSARYKTRRIKIKKNTKKTSVMNKIGWRRVSISVDVGLIAARKWALVSENDTIVFGNNPIQMQITAKPAIGPHITHELSL